MHGKHSNMACCLSNYGMQLSCIIKITVLIIHIIMSTSFAIFSQYIQKQNASWQSNVAFVIQNLSAKGEHKNSCTAWAQNIFTCKKYDIHSKIIDRPTKFRWITRSWKRSYKRAILYDIDNKMCWQWEEMYTANYMQIRAIDINNAQNSAKRSCKCQCWICH